jgi:hypothetical protein
MIASSICARSWRRSASIFKMSIPHRVVQTAAKLVLEPIFEADFDPNAYGYRPKRSAQVTDCSMSLSRLRSATSCSPPSTALRRRFYFHRGFAMRPHHTAEEPTAQRLVLLLQIPCNIDSGPKNPPPGPCWRRWRRSGPRREATSDKPLSSLPACLSRCGPRSGSEQ